MKHFFIPPFFILLTFSKVREATAFTLSPRMKSTHLKSTINETDGVNGEAKKLQTRKIFKSMPEHDQHGPVQPIDSIHSFLTAIETAPRNSIVVVQFHAKWCKVCARVIIKLRQMAQRILSKQTPVPVSFISVEVTANNEICSTLGIKKFPFVQMYRNAECVASFGTGPAHNFQPAVGRTLDEKLQMTESQWDAFRSEFKYEITDGLKKLEDLRLSKFYDGDGLDDSTEGGRFAP